MVGQHADQNRVMQPLCSRVLFDVGVSQSNISGATLILMVEPDVCMSRANVSHCWTINLLFEDVPKLSG